MNKRNPFKELTFWMYMFILGIMAIVVIDMAGNISAKSEVQLKETTATVQKMVMSGKNTYAYLNYKVAGIYYKDIKVATTKNLKSGETVTIYYNPENPFDADSIRFSKPVLVNNYIGLILGIFMFVVVSIPIIKYIRILLIHNKLADNNEHINAVVVAVNCTRKRTRNRSTGNRKRYMIYTLKCEGRYNGKDCTFIKKDLYFRPPFEEGSYIDVYVEPQNPDRYYIDCGLNAADIYYSSIKGGIAEFNQKQTSLREGKASNYNGGYSSNNYNSYNNSNSNNFRNNAYNNSAGNSEYSSEDITRLSSKISTSTFANDFDDFMNDLDKKE